MNFLRPTASWIASATMLASLAGCMVPKDDLDATNEKLLQAERQLDDLRRDNADLSDELAAKRKQIDSLMKLGDKRLEAIFHVVRIELGRYTGGFDSDGKPGQDAIKVYLDPIDADGSTIKAAGDVTIQLYDLAADPKANLLGEYHWSVAEISKQWSSGFVAYHYSFVCPFKSPPAHDEITIRVEFVDYLTGKTFTAQKAVKVELPPAAR